MAFNYSDTLDSVSKSRYNVKLDLIDLKECPYKLPAGIWENNPTKWPSIEYGDIHNYLVETPGVYTREAMKNYKSLEAHNYFRSGWVETVYCYQTKTSKHVILKANVKPSQRLNEEQYTPWVAVTSSGQVSAAHCNCMAGLAESCSHIGALLFKLEAAVRFGYNTRACTEEPCKWNKDFVKKIGPDPIAKVNFFNEKNVAKAKVRTNKRKQLYSESSGNEQEQFLQSLNALKSKPIVLSCFTNYSADFRWKKKPARDPKLPPPLTSMYRKEHADLNETDLKSKCHSELEKLSLSASEINFVCKSTIGQRTNLVWHEQRTGRITSSTVHSVIRTNQDKPAKSVIEQICYPRKKPLETEPIKWGNKHESVALNAYTSLMKTTNQPHKNVQLKTEGLLLSKEKVYIGASADGIMTCDCHGARLVEVKCPYSAKDMVVKDFLESKDCCIQNGLLKKNHKYYTQVQLQMFAYELDQCDFVVWTPKFMLISFVQRDDPFISDMISTCETFFEAHILPELLTRRRAHTSKETPPACSSGSLELFCICQTPEDDREYVGCDNPECKFKWCHMDCMKLKRKPKGTWFCPQCRKDLKKVDK